MNKLFSEEILRQAAAACFENAASHRGAARALFEAGFNSQAVALAAIGVEEFSKAILYAVAALVPGQRNDLPEKIGNHLEKQLVALSVEFEDVMLALQPGFPRSPEERLASCLTGLARSGIRQLRATPTGSERQEYTKRFAALFEALHRKDAGLYVDVGADGRLLLPDRVQDEAASEINGLGWFIDVYGALPAAMVNENAWGDLASRVRGDLSNDGSPSEATDSN